MSRGTPLEDKQALQRRCVESISKSLFSLNDKALELDNFKAYWQRVIKYQKWDHIHKLSVSNLSSMQYCGRPLMGQFKGPYLMFLIHNKEHNILTWKGVSKFIDTKFSSLGTLKMNGNHIGNNATKFFIKINLPMLNELHLENCNIGNEGCKNLLKGDWNKLKTLRVGTFGQKCISIDGTLPLIQYNSWPNLQFLETNSLKDEMTCFLFLLSFKQSKVGKSFFPANPSPAGVLRVVETLWNIKFPPLWKF